MTNGLKRYSASDVLPLLRQVPLSVYLFPVLATAFLYVVLGSAVWLLVTPYWKELAGEWDVVGKFVAIIAWTISFPVVFNLLLTLVVGVAFDPLASKVDLILHRSEHKETSIGNQWKDSILRTASLFLLQAIAFLVGLAIPVLGLFISGAVSVFAALILITTPAIVHRGIGFVSHVKLVVSNFRVREVVFAILAAVLLNNPLLQVVTLVPLIVMGQLVTRSWVVD
jgi:hypothetical protein